MKVAVLSMAILSHTKVARFDRFCRNLGEQRKTQCLPLPFNEADSFTLAIMRHSRPSLCANGVDAALSVEQNCLPEKLRKPRQGRSALRRQMLFKKENRRQ